jgi:hypothetical protein
MSSSAHKNAAAREVAVTRARREIATLAAVSGRTTRSSDTHQPAIGGAEAAESRRRL